MKQGNCFIENECILAGLRISGDIYLFLSVRLLNVISDQVYHKDYICTAARSNFYLLMKFTVIIHFQWILTKIPRLW